MTPTLCVEMVWSPTLDNQQSELTLSYCETAHYVVACPNPLHLKISSCRYITYPWAHPPHLHHQAQAFVARVEPLFEPFCDDRAALFQIELEQKSVHCQMFLSYDIVPLAGCLVPLVNYTVRNVWDLIDFMRIVKMIMQQWYRTAFDEEKDYLKSINLGVLPNIPPYNIPDGQYPYWVERLYNPWIYLDFPDGGILHNNPIMYPIQVSGCTPKKPKKRVSFADTVVDPTPPLGQMNS